MNLRWKTALDEVRVIAGNSCSLDADSHISFRYVWYGFKAMNCLASLLIFTRLFLVNLNVQTSKLLCSHSHAYKHYDSKKGLWRGVQYDSCQVVGTVEQSRDRHCSISIIQGGQKVVTPAFSSEIYFIGPHLDGHSNWINLTAFEYLLIEFQSWLLNAPAKFNLSQKHWLMIRHKIYLVAPKLISIEHETSNKWHLYQRPLKWTVWPIVSTCRAVQINIKGDSNKVLLIQTNTWSVIKCPRMKTEKNKNGPNFLCCCDKVLEWSIVLQGTHFSKN